MAQSVSPATNTCVREVGASGVGVVADPPSTNAVVTGGAGCHGPCCAGADDGAVSAAAIWDAGTIAAIAVMSAATARCCAANPGSAGARTPRRAAGISTSTLTANVAQPSQPAKTRTSRKNVPSSGLVMVAHTSDTAGTALGSGEPSITQSATGTPTTRTVKTTNAANPRATSAADAARRRLEPIITSLLVEPVVTCAGR